MHFHWQNLMEKKYGRKPWPWHGRAWLGRFRVEWYLWRLECRLSFERSQEELKASVAFPPFSLWLACGRFTRAPEREISVSIHGGAIWWKLWRDPWGGWSRDVPRWRDGNFNFADALLGRRRHSKQTLSIEQALVPMPEGPYRCTIELELATWHRPRWPWWPLSVAAHVANVDIPGGIPFDGKGENAWDCGADGLFGLHCEASTVEEAIVKVVASVLRSRRRYGGSCAPGALPPLNATAEAR